MKNSGLAFPPVSLFSTVASYAGLGVQPRATGTVVDFQQAQNLKTADADAQVLNYYLYLPPKLTPQQCVRAREMLAWSCEALAFRSGASVKAIREFESGSREILDVTRQALAYALESEGLRFFVGHEPVRCGDCPGATLDPRQRNDFHLVE